jgi:hypothetical protein
MKNPFIKVVVRADPDTEAECLRLRDRVYALEADLAIMAAALKRAMPDDHFMFPDEASAATFARRYDTTYRPLPGLTGYGVPCTVRLARLHPTLPLIALRP